MVRSAPIFLLVGMTMCCIITSPDRIDENRSSDERFFTWSAGWPRGIGWFITAMLGEFSTRLLCQMFLLSEAFYGLLL